MDSPQLHSASLPSAEALPAIKASAVANPIAFKINVLVVGVGVFDHRMQ